MRGLAKTQAVFAMAVRGIVRLPALGAARGAVRLAG